MNKLSKLFIFSILFLFIAGTLLFASDNDKMPITTKSEKAKEEFIKGRDLFEKLRIQESVEYFTNAINEDPDFALAYLYRAQTEPTAGKDFTSDLNKAVSLSNQVSEGERMVILGFEAGNNGNFSKEKDMLDKLISLFPNDERAHTLAAFFYGTVGDHQKAIDDLNKAIQINPSYSPAYNALGYAYRNSGKFDEAEKTFKKYIEVLPGDPNPYDSYAELLLKEGKYNEAIDNYKKALNVDPEFISSKRGIAAAYMYEGKGSDARDVLNELYKSAKNNGERENALDWTAISYVMEGNLDDAITQLNKENKTAMINIDYPIMSNVALRKGILYYNMGQYKDAQEQFQAALDDFEKSDASQEAKDNFKENITFNNVLISTKEQSPTMAAARSGEELLPKEESLNDAQKQQEHQVKAMMLLDRKDPDGALKELQQGNQQDPYNLYLMGSAYKLKGDTQNARNYFNQVINWNELPTLNSALARFNAQKALREIK